MFFLQLCFCGEKKKEIFLAILLGQHPTHMEFDHYQQGLKQHYYYFMMLLDKISNHWGMRNMAQDPVSWHQKVWKQKGKNKEKHRKESFPLSSQSIFIISLRVSLKMESCHTTISNSETMTHFTQRKSKTPIMANKMM